MTAMVEAVQIATEGRVRALYEKGIKSRQSGLPATGTGTDCVAVVSFGDGVERYCGKHTKLGELIGAAAYMLCCKRPGALDRQVKESSWIGKPS